MAETIDRAPIKRDVNRWTPEAYEDRVKAIPEDLLKIRAEVNKEQPKCGVVKVHGPNGHSVSVNADETASDYVLWTSKPGYKIADEDKSKVAKAGVIKSAELIAAEEKNKSLETQIAELRDTMKAFIAGQTSKGNK